jgi:hypothetical protein
MLGLEEDDVMFGLGSSERQFVAYVKVIVLMVLAPGFIVVNPSGVLPAGPEVPTGWVFALPAGDPAEGEKAFAKMQCYSCHKVPGKDFKDPSVEPGMIGPEFTAAYAALSASYLAESIINPDRFLPHGPFRLSYLNHEAFHPAGRDDYELHSRMASYVEIMTVKELIDIVAFLKSLDRVK